MAMNAGKASKFGRLEMRHALGALVIGILLTYQNCSQAPDAAQGGGASGSSYVNGLPFAYKAKVDTIAYMSCSEIKVPLDPRAYFSYRVGAYNNTTGGLSLTAPFMASTQYYSSTERGQALGNSELNSNTRLSLSIRSRGNLQQILAQGTLRVGDEIDSFLPPLDSPEVAGPLAGAASGRMMNYFPGRNDKRLVEASLRYYEFENVSKDTRTDLEGSNLPAYLVVGYSGSDDELETKLRSPAALPNQAYGYGYGLSFNNPNGWSSTERRVLGSVAEFDLTTNPNSPTQAPWDCSTSYQFMVLRPQDYHPGLAPYFRPIPDSATSAQQPGLNAIRRVLRVEDWFVDMDNMTVMPKRTADYCYGTLQSGQAVNYTKGVCVNGGATLCPHFVSVCIRH